MRSHLHMWYYSIHDELYKDSGEEATVSTMDDFVTKRVQPLPQSFEKAKKLTHAVCEMIAWDIWPNSIVDDVGF